MRDAGVGKWQYAEIGARIPQVLFEHRHAAGILVFADRGERDLRMKVLREVPGMPVRRLGPTFDPGRNHPDAKLASLGWGVVGFAAAQVSACRGNPCRATRQTLSQQSATSGHVDLLRGNEAHRGGVLGKSGSAIGRIIRSVAGNRESGCGIFEGGAGSVQRRGGVGRRPWGAADWM